MTNELVKRVALCLALSSVGALSGCEDVNCPLGSTKRNGYCLEDGAFEDGGPAAENTRESMKADARERREMRAEDPNAQPEVSNDRSGAAAMSGGAGTSGSGGKATSAGTGGSSAARKSGGAASGGTGAPAEDDAPDDATDGAADDDASNDGEADDSKSSGSSTKTSSSGKSNASDDADMSKEPEPPPSDPECEGYAGEMVCDGKNMITCNDDAQITETNPCRSVSQCEAGLDAGECGMCDPGEYKCVGKQLQVCSKQGKFQKERDCASEALCSEANESCDPAACTAGAKLCRDGGIVTCNEDLTGWDEIEHCKSPDLCDNSKKKCNDCKPNETYCDGDTLVTCDSNGNGPARMRCSGDTARCLGKQCVQCTSANDCSDRDTSHGCRQVICNMGNGTCGTGRPTNKDKACSDKDGYCNANGDCVSCTLDEHCEEGKECDPNTFKCRDMVVPVDDSMLLRLQPNSSQTSYRVQVAAKVRVSVKATWNNAAKSGRVAIDSTGTSSCTFVHEANSSKSDECEVRSGDTPVTLTIHRDDAAARCFPAGDETSLSLPFEDEPGSMDCSNPIVTLTAHRL